MAGPVQLVSLRLAPLPEISLLSWQWCCNVSCATETYSAHHRGHLSSSFFKGCQDWASISVVHFNLQSKSLNKLQRNCHCLSQGDEQFFPALRPAARFGNKVTSIWVMTTKIARAARTAGGFPSREERWGPQHLGTRGAPGPMLARSLIHAEARRSLQAGWHRPTRRRSSISRWLPTSTQSL